MKFWGHLSTITQHKILVMKNCFKCGLIKQGLLHDMSKYSPSEFLIGVKYYQGNQSPNNAEREDKGYSSAWLHHKGRNKHHLEYWIDYSTEPGECMCGCKMPERYVFEMFCDRIAASKIYNKSSYSEKDVLDYYERSKDHYMLHPDTKKLLEKLLKMLLEQGEEAAFKYIKMRYKHLKKQPKRQNTRKLNSSSKGRSESETIPQ